MRLYASILFATALGLAGCASTPHFEHTGPPVPAAGETALDRSAPDPRRLPMFAGSDGHALGWENLLAAVKWAEVVFVGEQHDDDAGHLLEQAIVADSLERFAGTALSMEMLERHEQPIVDDYLDGVIEAEPFVRLTNSANWGGEGMWDKWYHPMIDAAKAHGARVIAANAPRRYVRLARRLGYPRLREVARQTPGERGLFDTPEKLPEGGYRERFWEIMSEGHAVPATPAGAAGAGGSAASAAPESPREKEIRLVAGFRSQLVWDATMARSIDRALATGARKVIHILGQFHCDFGGGTVEQLRLVRPDVRIITISMQRTDALALREEDRERADIIVHTGDPPTPPPPLPPPEAVSRRP